MRSRKPGWASASVIVQAVSADSAVETRVWCTVIDVSLAARAGMAYRARASVSVDAVVAEPTVQARAVGALVHIRLATSPDIASRTCAGNCAVDNRARSAILAAIVRTHNQKLSNDTASTDKIALIVV